MIELILQYYNEAGAWIGNPPRAYLDTDTEQAMQMMEKFADELCACQDPACAQTVTDEITRWSQEQSRNRIEAPKLSERKMSSLSTSLNVKRSSDQL